MALRVVGLRVSPIYLDVVFILTDKIKSANFVYVVMSHNFTQGSVLGPLLFFNICRPTPLSSSHSSRATISRLTAHASVDLVRHLKGIFPRPMFILLLSIIRPRLLIVTSPTNLNAKNIH